MPFETKPFMGGIREESLGGLMASRNAAQHPGDSLHLDTALPKSDLASKPPVQPLPQGQENPASSEVLDPARVNHQQARTELEITRRHGIQNLHDHVLEQIRTKTQGLTSEARIRLSPPELGEIRIHMVMEDHRLTVRMEISEPLVRTLLERDLQQLKNTLSEAGIDVDQFELHQGKERSGRERRSLPGPPHSPLMNAQEEAGENEETTPLGPVRLAAIPGGVDYLVY
jgi:flagellar hook-length control protein FliK